jgi:uncharacterized protein (TIGR02266 family)
MSYTGASVASNARQSLGAALGALQAEPNIPPDVLNVAQNVAQAMGALFQAEQAADEQAGKAAVRSALGSLSQTLALLQDVRSQHPGISTATEALARVMSQLFPLTAVPTKAPPAPSQPVGGVDIPRAPGVPQGLTGAGPSIPPNAPAVRHDLKKVELEANIGANTESNFFVGFSGEIAEGGVFIATYVALERGQPCTVLVTLPGGFETKVEGVVKFVRDPMDFSSDSEPGVGVQFLGLAKEPRELILRFIKKRAPMFYDE